MCPDPSDRASRALVGGRRRTSSVAASLVALVALLAACTGGGPAPTPSPTPPPAVHDVGVQLFQWTWDSIATECTEDLGPAGYGWVLTSPPQEHILGSQWWTSYQPVSYQVESRLGTREQFAAMVSACHAAGVKVYADAVINHMTGQETPGVGWAGSSYEHFEYPGIYSDANGDFHHCGLTTNDDIGSYKDAVQVRTCELSNLADLATETEHVRTTIAAYLADLVSLGVDGFRIDAAKHMAPADIAAVIASLPDGTTIMQEVIRGSGEAVSPDEYLGNGSVYEFAWGRDVMSYLPGAIGLTLDLGTGAMYAPSDHAVPFVDNHDTERNGSTLSYKDGATYVLANVLLLASDYGTPQLYSGHAFTDRDAGPAQGADGTVLDASCAADVGPDTAYADGDWVCQHRWVAIAGMVGWRSVAGSQPVSDTWAQGDAVALGRGPLGFVVVNNGDDTLTASMPTQLPDGAYCDVLAGPATEDGACAGASATVTAGQIAVVVPAHTAQAWDVASPAPAPVEG
jgi:alpha-amylase